MFALSPSNAFADCHLAENCAAATLQGYNTQTVMGPNDVLGEDEDYVPGYETAGPAECMAVGEPLREGYELTAPPIQGCGAGPVSNFAWSNMGQRALRIKWSLKICVPFTLTVEYALGPVSPQGEWMNRNIGGCGQEVWRVTKWPTGNRCGPTSADPDCQ